MTGGAGKTPVRSDFPATARGRAGNGAARYLALHGHGATAQRCGVVVRVCAVCWLSGILRGFFGELRGPWGPFVCWKSRRALRETLSEEGFSLTRTFDQPQRTALRGVAFERGRWCQKERYTLLRTYTPRLAGYQRDRVSLVVGELCVTIPAQWRCPRSLRIFRLECLRRIRQWRLYLKEDNRHLHQYILRTGQEKYLHRL